MKKYRTLILVFIFINILQTETKAQSEHSIKAKGFDLYAAYNPFLFEAHPLHGIEVKLQRRTGKWVYGLEGNYYVNGLTTGLDNYKNLSPSKFYLQGLEIKNFTHYGFNFGRNIAIFSDVEIDANLMMGLIDFSATFYEFEYVDTAPNGTPLYLLNVHIFPRQISWMLRPTFSASYGINRFTDLEFNLGYNIVSDEMEGKVHIRGLVNTLGFRIHL